MYEALLCKIKKTREGMRETKQKTTLVTMSIATATTLQSSFFFNVYKETKCKKRKNHMSDVIVFLKPFNHVVVYSFDSSNKF